MNPLSADDSGQRKLLQLKRARSLGLSVPETVITNDPAVARIFVDLYGPDKVIRKGFRSLPNVPLYTSRMTGIDLGANSGLEHAPVIFQRFVEVDVDLRVTMVDGEVFAASIRSQPGYEADYRPGLSSAEVEPYELPDDVTTKLRALMKDLGLVYGAVDFRVTPEGEHVFLEINPAGEYLFIADRTGQPIPQAIAACLDRHDAEFSRSIVG